MTDDQLIRDVRDGSRQAFEALFERYRGPIWQFFRRRVPEAARAEELAQDTFVALLEGAHRYEARTAFEREITRVRTEIEQMESQLQQLDGRVEYATLTIEVQEERRASVNLGPIPVPTRLRQAVADGLESAAMSMLGAALLILRGGPVLLLWLTVLGLPVWWLLRRYAFRESRQPGV